MKIYCWCPLGPGRPGSKLTNSNTPYNEGGEARTARNKLAQDKKRVTRVLGHNKGKISKLPRIRPNNVSKKRQKEKKNGSKSICC